ncbi:hypothetical protein [Elizabethkingia anophelis]|uniref:hypothetical protein n=1 Tax=Elizabethkingia anophelis TaxID=1117645 RepID=UPI0024E1F27F|nr:hypothetical protein [Elizabethkingia anophelis]CAI9670809.1 hypothetical protein EAVNNN508_03843 [Elizabethkingia anophelis]CAI9672780.1 hypothetical protein EAVNVB490_00139 [Elizabethkingia anophelis]CAI9676856.1 hypothetical protein EAVNNN508_00137 [Elizabethkingia anophelis]CAI9676859.1 hypothetical protein EAVNNN508_00138 [Elizabethkingia anophelis]
MAKFRTPFTSMDEKNPIAEKTIGKSETVPDQSLTVREILKKYANGTLDDIGNRDIYYNDDDDGFDGVDLRGLDISELQQLERDAQIDIDEIQAMIKLQEQTTGNQEPNPSPSVPPTTETPDYV